METILKTDCKFLENELMDVVRLFEARPGTSRIPLSIETAYFITVSPWTEKSIPLKTRDK